MIAHRGVRRLGVVVSAVLLAAGSLAACSGSGTSSSDPPPTAPAGGIDPGTRFTPLAASVLTDPTPVKGTDGALHLAYELLLTNATPSDIGVDRLEVRDATTHAVLLSLAGPALSANMNLLGAKPGDESTNEPETPATPVPGSSVAIVWLDVLVPGPVPPTLEHHLVGAIQPAPGGQGVPFDSILARIPTSGNTAVVLGPPVGSGVWYASEGCCSGDTHHRRGLVPVNGQLLVAQRFAIDWFLLDDQHRTWIGDPAKLSSYLSYDQPVIAAADGTVADSSDGLPDSRPPQPPAIPPIQDTVGNHVTISIGSGLFLLYGHLKPGSVRVHTGQSVQRGQVLGQIGTSGNSTTPHLHFQVMTTPTFFPTDSPPFVFDRFNLVGQITQRIWDDDIGLQPTDVLPFMPAPQPNARQGEMPLDRNVVVFSP